MKKLFFIALALLVGCDNTDKEQSSNRDWSIFLACTGESISYAAKERDNVSYLIRLQPVSVQDSLLFYSDDERRFTRSACFRNFQKCVVTMDSDMIIELGTTMSSDESRVLNKIITSINRRTGEMHIFHYLLEDKGRMIFEGHCKKGESPIETPQKF